MGVNPMSGALPVMPAVPVPVAVSRKFGISDQAAAHEGSAFRARGQVMGANSKPGLHGNAFYIGVGLCFVGFFVAMCSVAAAKFSRSRKSCTRRVSPSLPSDTESVPLKLDQSV